MDANDVDSISIDGLGDVPSSSETRKARDGRKQVAEVSVLGECPVTGCSADQFKTFAELRGHFGKMNDVDIRHTTSRLMTIGGRANDG